MIINFDSDLRWVPTTGDLSTNIDQRRYYALDGDQLLILVLRQGVLASIDSMAGNLYNNGYSKMYDCLIGYHQGNSVAGYTRPAYEGYTHSKITVLRQMPLDTRAETTLSEILQGCPTIRDPGQRQMPSGLVPVSTKIPDVLLEHLANLAVCRGISVGDAIHAAIFEWVGERI